MLLLGEVHDSAAGHAARLERLQGRLAADWRPAIAMEQFDREQQPALDEAMRACADAACVVARVVPAKSGWNWDYYAPLIQLALDYDLPLFAANLSRADAGKVVRDGFDAALSPALIAGYRLDALPPALVAAQETEVRDSHCGQLPEEMVAPMARAQIARDVVMAETLRAHAGTGVVLIVAAPGRPGAVRRRLPGTRWRRAGVRRGRRHPGGRTAGSLRGIQNRAARMRGRSADTCPALSTPPGRCARTPSCNRARRSPWVRP
jgi:hypothetical protein